MGQKLIISSFSRLFVIPVGYWQRRGAGLSLELPVEPIENFRVFLAANYVRKRLGFPQLSAVTMVSKSLRPGLGYKPVPQYTFYTLLRII